MLLRSGSFAQSKQSARLVNKAHSLAPARTYHTARAALTSHGTSTAPCTAQSASAPRFPLHRPCSSLPALLRAIVARRRSLLAASPHWFPILDITDAMDLPAVVLERVVTEKTDASLHAHVRGFVNRDESRIAL